jgi:hypothetical protein
MFAVRQKTRSQKNAAVKNATGNGINIGWIGWPAILAVLRGFRVRGAIVIFTPSNSVGLSRLTRLSHGLVKLYARFAARSQASIGRRTTPVTTGYAHTEAGVAPLIVSLIVSQHAMVLSKWRTLALREDRQAVTRHRCCLARSVSHVGFRLHRCTTGHCIMRAAHFYFTSILPVMFG